MIPGFVREIGDEARNTMVRIGGMFLLFTETVKEVFRPPYRVMPVVTEVHEIGGKSLGVVIFLGFFTSMAVALQTGLTLKRFGGGAYVGSLVALSMLRELGPVLSGFMVAARAGSGIAAEIGAMRVSEQLDAMRACGANPVRELVMPKLIAAALVLPLLTAAGDLAGLLGGLAMSVGMLDIDVNSYFSNIHRSVHLGDFASGLIKTLFFGLIIATVSCYEGFHASYGSLGVSRAANSAVVTTFILILVADVMLIGFFIAHGGVYWQ